MRSAQFDRLKLPVRCVVLETVPVLATLIMALSGCIQEGSPRTYSVYPLQFLHVIDGAMALALCGRHQKYQREKKKKKKKNEPENNEEGKTS